MTATTQFPDNSYRTTRSSLTTAATPAPFIDYFFGSAEYHRGTLLTGQWAVGPRRRGLVMSGKLVHDAGGAPPPTDRPPALHIASAYKPRPRHYALVKPGIPHTALDAKREPAVLISETKAKRKSGSLIKPRQPFTAFDMKREPPILISQTVAKRRPGLLIQRRQPFTAFDAKTQPFTLISFAKAKRKPGLIIKQLQPHTAFDLKHPPSTLIALSKRRWPGTLTAGYRPRDIPVASSSRFILHVPFAGAGTRRQSFWKRGYIPGIPPVSTPRPPVGKLLAGPAKQKQGWSRIAALPRFVTPPATAVPRATASIAKSARHISWLLMRGAIRPEVIRPIPGRYVTAWQRPLKRGVIRRGYIAPTLLTRPRSHMLVGRRRQRRDWFMRSGYRAMPVAAALVPSLILYAEELIDHEEAARREALIAQAKANLVASRRRF